MKTKNLLFAYVLLALSAGFFLVLFNEIFYFFRVRMHAHLFNFLYGAGLFFAFQSIFCLGMMNIRKHFEIHLKKFYFFLAQMFVSGLLFATMSLLYFEFGEFFGEGYENYLEIFTFVHFFAGLFFFIEWGKIPIWELLWRMLYLMGFLTLLFIVCEFLLKPIIRNGFLPTMLFISAGLVVMAVYHSRYVMRKSWLLILNGNKAGMDIPLRSDITFIGNQEEDDINLSDYPDVSPSHAKIIRYGNAELFSLLDNDPFSRTWVNFRSSRDQVVNNRDLITIGTAKFMFCTKS